MPVLTLTTAGTRQAVLATPTSAAAPTSQFASRVTFENIGPGIVYLGFQKPIGVSNTVSSTVYDKRLQVGDGITIGVPGSTDFVDLAAIWFDADTNATKMSYATETF